MLLLVCVFTGKSIVAIIEKCYHYYEHDETLAIKRVDLYSSWNVLNGIYIQLLTISKMKILHCDGYPTPYEIERRSLKLVKIALYDLLGILSIPRKNFIFQKDICYSQYRNTRTYVLYITLRGLYTEKQNMKDIYCFHKY